MPKPLRQPQQAGGRSIPTPEFGAEVRALRKFRGMTLKHLSRVSGVSLSYLSVIERDAGNPSAEILESVAKALGVPVNWFFAAEGDGGPLERRCVVRAGDRRSLNTLYGRSVEQLQYADELLSSTIGGRFYMGLCTFLPMSTQTKQPMPRQEGEQHAVVIAGELELVLGDEVITLYPGDSYTIDARINHFGRNRTDKETVIVWVASHVVIPDEDKDGKGC